MGKQIQLEKKRALALKARSQRHKQPEKEATKTAKSTRNRKLMYFDDLEHQSSINKDETCPTVDAQSTKYRIVRDDVWSKLFHNLKCNFCSKTDLKVNFSDERGFQFRIQIVCSSCNETINDCYSSTQANNIIDINERMTSAFLEIGAGYAGMQRLGMDLNMNVMCKATFTKYVDVVHVKSLELQEKTREKTLQAVRKAYIEFNPVLANEEILNVAVTYDGSYHTRGFSSNEGIGIVIDIFTGLVLDYVVLSKQCSWCSYADSKFKNNKDEFDKALKIHVDSGKCEKNFAGSSGMMEVEAAAILWKRSVEMNKMRYVTVLSDGDCKFFEHLKKLKVYPDHDIEKQECVNHVGKRLYRALKNVVSDCTDAGVPIGGAQAGSLTEEKIRKLQGYYSSAIKKNAPDVDAMKNAIYATIYHCSSTDEHPKHYFCPVGKTSWCFWQRAIAEGNTPEDHSILKTFIRPDIAVKIFPAYVRLSRKDLLEKCTDKGTQNANECIHNSIWLKCPKNKATTRKKVEIGVAKTIAEFNMGHERTLQLEIQSTREQLEPSASLKIARTRDKESVGRSVRRTSEENRYKRKAKKKAKLSKERAKRKKEGPSYGAGIAD